MSIRLWLSNAIQVKAHLKQRLKLIAVITVGYTLKKTSTPALSVRNVFHLRVHCISI